MRISNVHLYFLPPKPPPIRSPFTRPTTFVPSTSSTTNKQTSKQTDLNHLIHHSIPASAKGTSSRPALGLRKEFYFVHFADRIKFWNLTAGDRVIIANCTKDYRGKIGTVYWVDRTTNRLSLIEPEFWTEERQVPHPELPEFIRYKPIEFEYESVRLMAPGSNEMYYEDLEEVEHESLNQRGKRYKQINWTRIGNRFSIYSSKMQNVMAQKEIIPWPLEPDWALDIQDSSKRLKIRESYFKRLESSWELEKKRLDGEPTEIKSQPASHVHPREMRKDLFASPMDTWKTTLDPDDYEDHSIWLSTSSKIRDRFFPSDYSGFSDRDRSVEEESLLRMILPPELAVHDWELRAGRHTQRYKTQRWESDQNDRLQSRIRAEIDFIIERLKPRDGNNDNYRLGRERLERLFKVGYYKPSLLSKPNQIGRDRPSFKSIKMAKQEIENLLDRAQRKERLATLDLLPALEQYNSNNGIRPS
ncbi:hypothetical protein BY996DRAFT_4581974 [Phakopsora pachyrhizi]|uniref:KOW domain-containing protein n=1 Tax=Phakopsora pachyrhizi TaxID=170000 RepID=A0AAV0BV90_PHAPC|nr:hypothetical protein BY996DRAFT_4581974 [Phakopsora pachyrhizi]CAH7690222.1 hypothetical protein PPACK8108_LOCUS25505 [Phakopsora pachyrhizi]